MTLFPKSRARIRREASEWVARLAEHSGAENHDAFRKWRDADPRHGEAYDRIAAIWDQAGQLSRSPDSAGAPSGARPDRPRSFGFALAASLAVALLVTTLLLGPRWRQDSAPERQEMEFAAAAGEIREMRLPDGSRLRLDSASRVEAAFTSAERRLILSQGRARFEVAHDGRPFVVQAGSSQVVATGTVFDVSLIGGRTTVILLEGSVEVRAAGAAGEPQRLTPGETLTLTASGPAERRPAARGEADWATRMLEFDETRLDEAVALSNRYSAEQLQLGDERLGSLRVSGAFRGADAAGFARSLAAAFDLRVVRRPGGHLLLVDAGPHASRTAPQENISGG